jgi:SAM-dependent methyltransferase
MGGRGATPRASATVSRHRVKRARIPSMEIRKAFLQSKENWAARTAALAGSLSQLIHDHATPNSTRGLEVGCQRGAVVDLLDEYTDLQWCGVDPKIDATTKSPRSIPLFHGWAHDLPFADLNFDCVVLANVFEHIEPSLRLNSLIEIRRVLRKGGILVGQLPNPYFPIESHSRLPFMGWLPRRLQRVYWHLSPVDWDHDFYSATIRHLQRCAGAANFQTVLIRRFNYPLAAIPDRLKPFARLLDRAISLMPWSWQFVFRKQ